MQLADIKVTIGMSVLNGESFLQESLRSALTQTHENFEILIFDDGSTDSTISIIESIDDPRITLVHSDKNFGTGSGRQVVKTLAHGDYLVWLDADDIFLPRRIETLLEHAITHKSDITCDVYQLIDEEGHVLEQFYGMSDKVNVDKHFTRLFERNVMIPHPLISRNCFDSIDFDKRLKSSDDYDYWLKCSYGGFTFSFVDEINLQYRISEKSQSSNPRRCREETAMILNKYQITSLEKLYRSRGFSEEIINYMVCLQYIFRGEYEKALEYAKKKWADEDGVDQNFYVGTLFLRNNKFDQAKKYLERHLKMYPNSPSALNNMGVLLNRSGENAKPLFKKALEYFPGYVDVLMNLESVDDYQITDTQIHARD